MYAEATGDYIHTLTVLVDLRENPESDLAELVSGMLRWTTKLRGLDSNQRLPR